MNEEEQRQAALEVFGRTLARLFPGVRASGNCYEHAVRVTAQIESLVLKERIAVVEAVGWFFERLKAAEQKAEEAEARAKAAEGKWADDMRAMARQRNNVLRVLDRLVMAVEQERAFTKARSTATGSEYERLEAEVSAALAEASEIRSNLNREE